MSKGRCEHCGDDAELHKVKYADDNGIGSMMICEKCDDDRPTKSAIHKHGKHGVARAKFDTESEARAFMAGVEAAGSDLVSIEGLYRKNGKYYVQLTGVGGTIRTDMSAWKIKKG